MNAWKYLCFFHMGRDLGGQVELGGPGDQKSRGRG